MRGRRILSARQSSASATSAAAGPASHSAQASCVDLNHERGPLCPRAASLNSGRPRVVLDSAPPPLPATVEAFEDRICIHQGKNVTLSAEDIISCHTDENMSCQGGNPIAVWQNIFAGRKEGDGAIEDGCYPYTLPTCPCNHHSLNSSLPKCPPEGTISTPTCDLMKKFSCEDKVRCWTGGGAVVGRGGRGAVLCRSWRGGEETTHRV